MPPGTQYLLPDGVGLAAAEAALSARASLEKEAVRSVDRMFYDTFDGRLHADGLQLTQEGGLLRLFHGSTEQASAELGSRPPRLLAEDLPSGPLRNLVAPVVDMRALTPIVRIRSRMQVLRVLDDEGKTVVRMLLEEPLLVSSGRRRARVQARLHVSGVRGYGKALARVRRTLEDEVGLPVARRPVQDEAVAATGGSPDGISSKLDVTLRAGQRADAAARILLVQLLVAIEVNLPGTLADIDSEFLHDFRVAVRRTRSLQRQLKHVFPPEPLERFRADFRWLQQVTGPVRDLDVYLLELEEGGELAPLRGLLAERRERERRRMLRALRSERTAAILAGWAAFVTGLVDRPETDRPDAARPIADVAGARIAAVYKRMVKDGNAIGDESPAEALHELRKLGKELRYLLEFFASLFPGKVVKPMVRTLKGLQDTLGRFQDREVQADVLLGLGDEVAALDRGPAALMAMGTLVARLEADQAAAREEFAERFAAFADGRQRALVRETFA
jgi:CHAD domain-containing protein